MANALPNLLLAVSVLGAGAACESDARVEIEPPVTPGEIVDAEAMVPRPDASPPSTTSDAAPPPTPDAEPAPTADARTQPPPDAGPLPTSCQGVVCEPVSGLSQTCALVPAENADTPSVAACVPVPARAYRIALNADLDASLGGLLPPELGHMLAEGSEGLAVVFPDRGEEPPPDPFRFRADIVQDAFLRPDGAWEGRAGQTRASAFTVVLDSPPPGAMDPSEMLPVWFVGPVQGAPAPFHLRVGQATADGAVCSVPLLAVVNLVFLALPTDDASGHQMVGRLATCLPGPQAARVTLADGRRLSAALEAISDPICDSNDDGNPDGWPITPTATLTPIDFAGDPAAFLGAGVDTPDCP